MTDAWNNGPLILATAAMLLLVVLSIRGRIGGVRLAVACAVITAIGFLMKQTFMLSGGACALLLLGTAPGREWRERLRDCAVFGALFLLLTSPYWATNLARYGDAMHAPVHQFHLQHHYAVSPWSDYYRRVLWDEQPLGLREVVNQVGVLQMVRSELDYMRQRVAAIASPNPLLLIPAALGVLLMRRGQWRIYAAVASLTLGPLFDTALWFPEPRYLLPIFPCLFFLGWLAVRNYREWARDTMQPPLRSRARRGFVVVLVGAAVYAVVMGWPALHKEMIWARTPTPSWRELVRSLPTDVVVMSDQPPAVSWWTRRHSMAAPVDERADLVTVLRVYRPSYYLDLGTHPALESWKPGELEEVASGAGWTLHRIRTRDFGES